MKKLLFTLLLTFFVVIVFNACSDDEVDACNCPAATPWSKADISKCYASKADCESANGGTCINCN